MTSLALKIAGIFVATSGLVYAGQPHEVFKKEVTSTGKTDESLVAVRLDADVYSSSKLDYGDLRLLDPSGTSVPYFIRKSQEVGTQTVRRRTWTATNPSLRPLENGGLEITLKLDDDDPQPNGLTLVTPLRDFEQRVQVLTSANGETWEPVANNAVIFDYSRYMDVRNDAIAFPASSRKHFRIVIDDVTAEQQSELLELTRRLQGNNEAERTERVTIARRPFRIERIHFWQESTAEKVKDDHKQSYPVVGFKVTDDAKAKQTIIEIDTRREPLTSFSLETSSRNFSRNGMVEIPEQRGTQTTWRQIGAVTISRLDFKTLKREQLKIEFRESRESRYRITIDNRDSVPLNITGIAAEGNVYELIFLSATDNKYQLTYGDQEATTPNYDTASLQALLTERYRPEVGQLGPQVKMAGMPSGFKWSTIVNDPRLLTGIVAILVLVLGWALYGAVKRIDSSSEGPPTL